MDLILTGRPIKAKEAFEWGLANRLVAIGTGKLVSRIYYALEYYFRLLGAYLGLGQAVSLASSLKKYPQKCLQADRRSAYYATYSASSLEDALQYEFENGKEILSQVKMNLT